MSVIEMYKGDIKMDLWRNTVLGKETIKVIQDNVQQRTAFTEPTTYSFKGRELSTLRGNPWSLLGR